MATCSKSTGAECQRQPQYANNAFNNLQYHQCLSNAPIKLDSAIHSYNGRMPHLSMPQPDFATAKDQFEEFWQLSEQQHASYAWMKPCAGHKSSATGRAAQTNSRLGLDRSAGHDHCSKHTNSSCNKWSMVLSYAHWYSTNPRCHYGLFPF